MYRITRFVRASQDEMERMRDDLTGIRNELASLRHRIGRRQADAPEAEPAESIALPEHTTGDA